MDKNPFARKKYWRSKNCPARYRTHSTFGNFAHLATREARYRAGCRGVSSGGRDKRENSGERRKCGVTVLFCYDSCRNRRRRVSISPTKGRGRTSAGRKSAIWIVPTGILDESVYATILQTAIRCDSFHRGTLVEVVVEAVGVKVVDSDREYGEKPNSGRWASVAPWVTCSMLRVYDRRILWLQVRPARRSLVRRNSTTICSSFSWWATATSASRRSWAASRTAPRSRRSAVAAVRCLSLKISPSWCISPGHLTNYVNILNRERRERPV